MGKKKKKKSKAHHKLSNILKGDINRKFIEEKIVQGNSKLALDLAKQFHKENQSDESEMLLVYSYLLRIQAMSEKNLMQEAVSLLDSVQQSFPKYQEKMEEMSLTMMVQSACSNNLIKLFSDEKSLEEKQRILDNLIRSEITDLSTIANCVALPEENPIRKEAALLNEAFLSVTSGPVSEDTIALNEIPRRSPLSSWKMLIKAIASFYRKNDEICKKYLDLIHPESAPARLVVPLKNIIDEKKNILKYASEIELYQNIYNNTNVDLVNNLKRLDSLYDPEENTDPQELVLQIHATWKYIKKKHPDLLNNLNRLVTIKLQLVQAPKDITETLIDTEMILDTFFYKHWALSLQTEKYNFDAVCAWEGFRRQAIIEGLFKKNSPEESAVYAHMAQILMALPHRELDETRVSFKQSLDAGLPSEEDDFIAIKQVLYPVKKAEYDLSFLYPELLFEKICKLDPDPEYFLQWYDYEKQTLTGNNTENVLLAWHSAQPKDSRPLMMLVKSLRNRSVLKKSLDYLKIAESIDGLNPEIIKAQLVLQILFAFQHVHQKKAHLVEKDIKKIEDLPQSKTGDRPAILTALKWACSIIKENPKDAEHYFNETSEIFDSTIAANLIIRAVASKCGISEKEIPKLKKSKEVTYSIIQAYRLCKDIEIKLSIPIKWERYIIGKLSLKNNSFDSGDLLVLAEAALANNMQELAYRVSSIGLENRYDDARYLFIRAQSLPGDDYPRMESCISAVQSIAQKQRNLELLNEAIDWKKTLERKFFFLLGIFGGFPGMGAPPLDIEEVEDILNTERKNTKFPAVYINQKAFEEDPLDVCNCPVCRRKRKERDQREKARKKKTEKKTTPTERAKTKMKQKSEQKSKQLFLFDETDEVEN